jgi:hypothetical protein
MLLAAWEAIRSHVGSYQVWEMCGKIPGGTDPVSQPYFFRGRDGSKNLIIFIYNCYICILLIKTNSIIYICYIFCEGGVEIYMLTVRDNEHDSENGVRDNEVMLWKVAKGGDTQWGHVWEGCEGVLVFMGNVPKLQRDGDSGTGWGQEPSRNPYASTGGIG